ncbi:MAG TPA: FAD-dependent oxidoreductase [Rhodoblastus sp.]|nr:FAD-dependent oxidoreductase [Rhodoblastus sp.]
MNEEARAPQESYDAVVVGAGAGGLVAACAAAMNGCSVLLVEQADVVGGTTAISGGMVWLPGNHKMAEAGRPDSLAAARAYLAATVPGADRARLETFLARGDEALRDLEAHTSLRLQPVLTYPDYYPDLPGATTGGRVLEPVPFDARELGKFFALVRPPLPEFMLFGGMMISRADIPHLRRATRSARSARRSARLVLQYAWQRLGAPRGASLYLGNALVARLLKSAIDLGVRIETGATVDALGKDEHGRIAIVDMLGRSGRRRVAARRGVVLATGGLSHDPDLRRRFTPDAAGALTASVQPGAAPRGARLAVGAGAALSPPTQDGAFWAPASTFKRKDGSAALFPHTVTDRAKPGLIAVDANGRRFVNEAVSYHEFVRAQLRNANSAIPAWLVCDRNFLWKYGLGKVKPFSPSHEGDVSSGYLKRAATIADLARAIGAPAAALVETVAEFNRHAGRGEDPAFGRGGDVYQRSLGDADHGPNPCVAPIVQAPFFAVAVAPADLGMSAGVRTDAEARALTPEGTPIPGLYACGNDMASIMEGAYPGPGVTLGPALVFGWIAGRHLAAAT